MTTRDAREIAREIAYELRGDQLPWSNRGTAIMDRALLADRIAAAIEKDRAEREAWLPIETAPRDGTEILGYAPRLGQLVVSYDDGGDQQYPWCSLDGPCYRAQAFTRWRLLPSPPSEER